MQTEQYLNGALGFNSVAEENVLFFFPVTTLYQSLRNGYVLYINANASLQIIVTIIK